MKYFKLCLAHKCTSINAQNYYRIVSPHPQIFSGLGLEYDIEWGVNWTSNVSSTLGILCQRKVTKYGQLDSEAISGLTLQINTGLIFWSSSVQQKKGYKPIWPWITLWKEGQYDNLLFFHYEKIPQIKIKKMVAFISVKDKFSSSATSWTNFLNHMH